MTNLDDPFSNTGASDGPDPDRDQAVKFGREFPAPGKRQFERQPIPTFAGSDFRDIHSVNTRPLLPTSHSQLAATSRPVPTFPITDHAPTIESPPGLGNLTLGSESKTSKTRPRSQMSDNYLPPRERDKETSRADDDRLALIKTVKIRQQDQPAELFHQNLAAHHYHQNHNKCYRRQRVTHFLQQVEVVGSSIRSKTLRTPLRTRLLLPQRFSERLTCLEARVSHLRQPREVSQLQLRRQGRLSGHQRKRRLDKHCAYHLL